MDVQGVSGPVGSDGDEAAVDPRLQLVQTAVGATIVKQHNMVKAMHLIVGHPLREEALLIPKGKGEGT